MIPTNDLRNFAQYRVITTVRQSDSARLIATRVIIDERLPVRWDVEISYPQPTTFSTGLVRSRIEPPSTSKLIQKAQEEGFGDWYPVPEKMEEISLGMQKKALNRRCNLLRNIQSQIIKFIL